MRILVCGDRNWEDKELIRSVLSEYEPGVLIEGEARGADRLAGEVGVELGWEVLRYPAQWDKYGKAAGPVRNKQMLVEGQPDLVVACHDDLDNSKGTKNMVEISVKAGVPVLYLFH